MGYNIIYGFLKSRFCYKCYSPTVSKAIAVTVQNAFVTVLIISALYSCAKEPPLYDPNCGVITYNQQVGDTWVVWYRWNDGETDTITWWFPIESQPGDTVCKLMQVDWDELNCNKP